ncbi:hypothetical protein Tco_0917078 [Tanacetum coccineum]
MVLLGRDRPRSRGGIGIHELGLGCNYSPGFGCNGFDYFLGFVEREENREVEFREVEFGWQPSEEARAGVWFSYRESMLYISFRLKQHRMITAGLKSSYSLGKTMAPAFGIIECIEFDKFENPRCGLPPKRSLNRSLPSNNVLIIFLLESVMSSKICCFRGKAKKFVNEFHDKDLSHELHRRSDLCLEISDVCMWRSALSVKKVLVLNKIK